MFFITAKSITMAALHTVESWKDAVECLEFLEGVLGLYPERGLWKKDWKRVEEHVTVQDLIDRSLHGSDSDLEMSSFLNDLRDVNQFGLTGIVRRNSCLEYNIRALPKDTDNLCWTGLFESAYVGNSSPKTWPGLNWLGKGLRTSFEMMISLAGVQNYVEHDGSFIFVGFQTALIPILRLWDGSVQWHLIISESQSRLRAVIDQERFWDMLPEVRLQHVPFDSLKGISYIGWIEEAKICLGVEDMPLPKRSGLLSVQHRWALKERGFQFGLQSSTPTPIQLSGQLIQTHGRYSTIRRFPCSNVFNTMIDAVYRAKTFIFDDQCKTMWLCPTVNLLIFMLRHYLSSNGYNPTNLDTIRFPDGLETARLQIKSLQDQLIQDGSSVTYGDILVELVNRYSCAFGKIQDESSRTTLLGYELLDILQNESCFPATALPCKGSIQTWSPLIGNDDIVFCKDLGNVMKPADEYNIPPCSKQPPTGYDLLVAPITLLLDRFNVSLEVGYERRGENGYRWVYSGTPFTCSAIPTYCDWKCCWRDRLQTIVRTDGWREKLRKLTKAESPKLESTITLPRHGAVCFGFLVSNSKYGMQTDY